MTNQQKKGIEEHRVTHKPSEREGKSFGARFRLLWTIGNAISLIYCITTGAWMWFFSGILLSAVIAAVVSLVVECAASGARVGMGKFLQFVGGGVALFSGASIAWVSQTGLKGGFLGGSIVALLIGLLLMGVGYALQQYGSN